MDKLYLVTIDGYELDYGAMIYCVGLFSTLEKAQEAISKQIESHCDLDENWFCVTGLELNEIHDIEFPNYEFNHTYMTDIFLGGM